MLYQFILYMPDVPSKYSNCPSLRPQAALPTRSVACSSTEDDVEGGVAVAFAECPTRSSSRAEISGTFSLLWATEGRFPIAPRNTRAITFRPSSGGRKATAEAMMVSCDRRQT